MMRLFSKVPAALLAGLLGVSVASAAVLEDVVVSVNGEDILLSTFDKHVNAYVEATSRMRPGAFSKPEEKMALKKEILDQLIGDLLFRQKADKEKVKVSQRELDNAVEEIKKRMFGVDERGKPVSDKEREKAFNDQLKKDGLSLAKFREDIRDNLKIKKFYDQRIVPSVTRPSDKEIREYYDRAKNIAGGDESSLKAVSKEEREPLLALAEQFKVASAERIGARHILIKVAPDASILEKSKALNKVKALKKKIEGGSDFGELAKANSEDPGSAQRGGLLPPFVKGMMVPEFEKAAFALRVGEMSAPVLTDFGYHLIRLEERRAAQTIPYEEAQGQILEFLYNIKVQTKLQETAKELRAGAKIRFHGEGKAISQYETKASGAGKKKG